METRQLDKGEWIFLLIEVLTAPLLYFRLNDWVVSLIMAGVIALITFLAIKFNLIKRKTKEERELRKLAKAEKERLEKEYEDSLKLKSIKELVDLEEESQDRVNTIEEELKNRDNGSLRDIVRQFMAFGLIIFFVSLFYFGTFMDRVSYVSSITNSLEIAKQPLVLGISNVLDAFRDLFIKMFDLGTSTRGVFGIGDFLFFKWIYWIMITYWIGWLYFWKILMKGSWWTIKELFIPMGKNLIKRFKEGQHELNKKG